MSTHSWRGWLGPAAAVIALDQGTKFWVTSVLKLGDSIPMTNFFNLVLTYNRGVAFSMFNHEGDWQRIFFAALAVIASAVIVYLLRRHANETLFSAGLSLILGGAIGNLIDRVAFGHVIDFLDFHLTDRHWPAFNIADSAITIGAALLIIDSFRNKPAPLAIDVRRNRSQ